MIRFICSTTTFVNIVSPHLCSLCHLISHLGQLCSLCISTNLSNTLESGDGGAVSLRLGSSATLFSGCLFSDNFAVNGGAISGDFATATLHYSTMHFNEATGNVSILRRFYSRCYYSCCFYSVYLHTCAFRTFALFFFYVGRRCSHARRSTVHVQLVSFFFLVQCRFRW